MTHPSDPPRKPDISLDKTTRDILLGNPKIEGIEQTYQSGINGKWLFIIKRGEREEVKYFLEGMLEEYGGQSQNL